VSNNAQGLFREAARRYAQVYIGGEQQMTDSKVTVTIKNNGPIRIEGEGFQIQDAQGNVFGLGGRTAVSLCRCGVSKKQPFCDGSHGECKFCSEVCAYDLPAK
jgi:CDGSH-type Zn-finger protein